MVVNYCVKCFITLAPGFQKGTATINVATFSITTLRIKTFSGTTRCIKPISIATFSVMTLSITRLGYSV